MLQSSKNTKTWICSVRNRHQRCYASVLEKGSVFKRGAREHIHPADPGVAGKHRVSVAIKDQAKTQRFQSAMSLVDEAMLALPEGAHQLPNPSNLKRMANRVRQSMRPKDPTDLDFEVRYKYKI